MYEKKQMPFVTVNAKAKKRLDNFYSNLVPPIKASVRLM